MWRACQWRRLWECRWPSSAERLRRARGSSIGRDTSLAVIAANSFAGWLGHLGREPFAWGLTGAFLLAALVGMAAGARLGGRMRSTTLRLAFGWFVLAVAGFVVVKNWPALMPTSPPTQQ